MSTPRRLLLALLAGAAPATALALSLPAEPWRGDPDDQFLLEIAVRQLRLGDGARAYATPEGVCVIFQDVVGAMDLPVEIDPETDTAKGWAFQEKNAFAIDRKAGTMRVRGASEPLPPAAVRDAPEGWCVDTSAMSHWLGIGVKANTAGSMLFLQSEAKLPVELARERRDRAVNLLRKTSFDLRRLPKVALPYQMWRAPAADVLLSFGLLHDRRTRTRLDRSAAFLGAGELAGLSYETRVGTDPRGHLNLLRLRAYRADPDGGLLGPLGATHVAVGDVDSYVSPLSMGGVSGRGAMITNRPLHLQSSFDRTSFSGELPQGWDAELYRNGQLLAFGSAGADGRYRFDNVQLLYGDNQFEIVSYGPQGQVRRRTEMTSVGLDFVPPGKTWYWAGLVDPDHDLIRLSGEGKGEGSRGGARGTLALEHGIDQRTSVGLLFQSMTLDGRRTTWSEATLRRSIGPALVEAGAARDGNGGTALRGQAVGKIGPVNLSLQSLFSDGFRSFGSGVLARRDHRATVDAPLRLGRTMVPLQADVQYRLLDGGARQLEANARTSLQFSRFNLALAGKLLRNANGVGRREQDQWTLSALGSGNVRGIRVRTAVDWRIGRQSGLKRAEVAGYWNGGDRADWEGAVGWDGEYRRARARLGYVRRFAGLAGNVSVEAASDRSVAAGLGLSFSLGSNGGRPRFFREPLATGGNVRATVFRDLNGDGRRSEGEPLEPDAILTAGLRFSEQATDAKGTAFVTGLESFQPVAIGVDTSSLKDPTLAPARAAQVVTPRPGLIAHVDIPLVGAGTIEGLLLKDGGTGYEGLDLELVDEDGHVVATTRSDFDGLFLFERVTYGRYRVRLTEPSAKVAGVGRELESDVQVSDEEPMVRIGAHSLVRRSDKIASTEASAH